MTNLIDFEVPSDGLICDLFMQQVVTACVTAADCAGLFSKIGEASVRVEALATDLQIDMGAVRSVLNVLVAFGYCQKKDESYSLSPEARTYLLKGSPIYRGYQFQGASGYGYWHERILKTLESGWSPIGQDGKSFTAMWEEGTVSQQAADRFTGMMHTNISGPAIAVAKSGVFESYQHIADVGGGSGVFLSALRQLYPKMKLTLAELPQVCHSAEKIMGHYVDTKTIDFFPCNMFVDSWPDSVNAFFMSNILHDWPKPKAQKILNAAAQALPDGGDIFIYECLLDDSRLSPPHTVVFDVLMYMNHQSQQYTQAELTELLSEAGFGEPEPVFRFGYYTLLRARL